MKRRRTKFSRHGDLVPGVKAADLMVFLLYKC